MITLKQVTEWCEAQVPAEHKSNPDTWIRGMLETKVYLMLRDADQSKELNRIRDEIALAPILKEVNERRAIVTEACKGSVRFHFESECDSYIVAALPDGTYAACECDGRGGRWQVAAFEDVSIAVDYAIETERNDYKWPNGRYFSVAMLDDLFKTV